MSRIRVPYLTHKSFIMAVIGCSVSLTMLSGVFYVTSYGKVIKPTVASVSMTETSSVDIHIVPNTSSVTALLSRSLSKSNQAVTSASIYDNKLNFKYLGKYTVKYFEGGKAYALTSSKLVSSVSGVTVLAPSSIPKGTKIYIDGVGIRCVTYGTVAVPKNTVLVYSNTVSTGAQNVKTANIYSVS